MSYIFIYYGLYVEIYLFIYYYSSFILLLSIFNKSSTNILIKLNPLHYLLIHKSIILSFY